LVPAAITAVEPGKDVSRQAPAEPMRCTGDSTDIRSHHPGPHQHPHPVDSGLDSTGDTGTIDTGGDAGGGDGGGGGGGD
jgi:hypothetical protein